jgi:RNA polymerase sigma-70 factor (ECF subfamily)
MAVTTSKDQAVRSEDDRCIAECLNGSPEAFGQLVRKYQDRLFSTVVQVVGSEEDARDVVQDAFVRAFEALGAFQGQSAFYTWLYRIAMNGAISLRRRKRPTASVDAMRDCCGEEPVEHSEEADPANRVERDDMGNQVQAALGRLSDEHRSVLVLREMEEQSYEQIAQVLECPVGTVRSRLFRARMELRRLLAPVWEERRESENAEKNRAGCDDPGS